MSYFTFEHDCSNAPLTLTIEVEYSIYNFSGNYYEPAETSVKDHKFKLLCAGMDLTTCIMNSKNDKLIAELEEAIIEAIWENEDNQ
jgi:hypothetical protein